jgi:hypothetical protein
LEDDPFTEDDDDFVDEEDGTDCIFWSKEEWESFINSLSQDNYPGFDVEISYINMCAVTQPELKKRGLDFRKMVEDAGKGVDWDEAAEDQTWLYGNEEKVDFFDKTIYVVSPEDLLISKLIWIQDFQSPQQMEDIKNLTAIEQLDWPYITKWINKLNLRTFDLIKS